MTECRVFLHNLRVGTGTHAIPVWEKHGSCSRLSGGDGRVKSMPCPFEHNVIIVNWVADREACKLGG